MVVYTGVISLVSLFRRCKTEHKKTGSTDSTEHLSFVEDMLLWFPPGRRMSEERKHSVLCRVGCACRCVTTDDFVHKRTRTHTHARTSVSEYTTPRQRLYWCTAAVLLPLWACHANLRLKRKISPQQTATLYPYEYETRVRVCRTILVLDSKGPRPVQCTAERST